METPRIFVSHSHLDDAWCQRFVLELRDAGYDIWYDAHSLRGGDTWVEIIEHELQQRKVFMIILSPAALESHWVKQEYQLAISEQHTIIRVQHKETETSGFLSLQPVLIDAVGQDSTSAAQQTIAKLIDLYGPVEQISPLSISHQLELSPSPKVSRRRQGTLLFAGTLALVFLLLVSTVLVVNSRFAAKQASVPTATTVYGLLSDGSAVALKTSDGSLRWPFQREGDHLFPYPTISNGLLYLSSLNGYLYAIDATNGKFKWQYKLGNVTTVVPTISNKVVYVVLEHSVDALSSSDGTLLRHYQVGNDNSFLPLSVVVSNGIVYITASDYVPDPSTSQCQQIGCVGTTPSGGSLYAFKGSDGSLLWHSHTNSAGYSSPTIANGIVYISDGASIIAFRGSDGQRLWNYPLPGPMTPLLVSNGVVCCSHGHDDTGYFISAISAKDGHALWKYAIPSFRYPDMTLHDDIIYLFAYIGTFSPQPLGLRALQITTGKLLWSFPKSMFINGSVNVVRNGIAYLSSRDDGNVNDSIDALRIKDGSLVWSLKTVGLTSLTEADGILYTGIQNPTADPHLYAIRASDGKIVWQYLAKANVYGVQVGL